MLALQAFTLEVDTTARTDILDLTHLGQEKVEQTGIRAGLVNLFISGSTAALTTIEYESGVVNDLRAAIERLFPQDLVYEHDRRWGEGPQAGSRRHEHRPTHLRRQYFGPVPVRGARPKSPPDRPQFGSEAVGSGASGHLGGPGARPQLSPAGTHRAL